MTIGMIPNLSVISGPSLIIPNGTAVSNVITKNMIGGASSITLYAPTTLAETCTIEVSDNAAGTGTFRTLQEVVGTDTAPPLAGKARVFNIPYAAFRIKSGSNVAADRTFAMTFMG